MVIVQELREQLARMVFTAGFFLAIAAWFAAVIAVLGGAVYAGWMIRTEGRDGLLGRGGLSQSVMGVLPMSGYDIVVAWMAAFVLGAALCWIGARMSKNPGGSSGFLAEGTLGFVQSTSATRYAPAPRTLLDRREPLCPGSVGAGEVPVRGARGRDAAPQARALALVAALRSVTASPGEDTQHDDAERHKREDLANVHFFRLYSLGVASKPSSDDVGMMTFETQPSATIPSQRVACTRKLHRACRAIQTYRKWCTRRRRGTGCRCFKVQAFEVRSKVGTCVRVKGLPNHRTTRATLAL